MPTDLFVMLTKASGLVDLEGGVFETENQFKGRNGTLRWLTVCVPWARRVAATLASGRPQGRQTCPMCPR